MGDVEREQAALEVWLAARIAAGEEPGPLRVARVRDKLTDPAGHLEVAERNGAVVGMALGEPFREHDGSGAVRPLWGHISMVFVRPDSQGTGVGTELLRGLVSGGPWTHLSVWTRESNRPARRLYQGCGFVLTGESGTIRGGEVIQRWERCGDA